MTSDHERLAVLRVVRDCGKMRFWGSFAIAADLPQHQAESALRSLFDGGFLASDRKKTRGELTGGWYMRPAGVAELERLEQLEGQR